MQVPAPGLEDEPRHVEDEGGGDVSTTLAVLAQHPAEAANFCPETIIRLLSPLSSRFGLQFVIVMRYSWDW